MLYVCGGGGLGLGCSRQNQGEQERGKESTELISVSTKD
jgi:hypothetical protein